MVEEVREAFERALSSDTRAFIAVLPPLWGDLRRVRPSGGLCRNVPAARVAGAASRLSGLLNFAQYSLEAYCS